MMRSETVEFSINTSSDKRIKTLYLGSEVYFHINSVNKSICGKMNKDKSQGQEGQYYRSKNNDKIKVEKTIYRD